jgi:predicted dehydrogenase
MDQQDAGRITRRAFAGAAAFSIVPRHVLGAPFVPPSDRITVATVGAGRQGQAVTQTLLARPDVQVVALCDVNRGSKNYVEYGNNDLLRTWRALMGPGYENWGQDLASPGRVQICQEFSTSLGMGGREPVKRAVEAYYAAKKGATAYKGCNAYVDYRELLEQESGVDAIYIATPDHWHAAIAMAAMRRRKHVLCQKPMAHSVA